MAPSIVRSAAFGAALAAVLLGFEGLAAAAFFPDGIASRSLRAVLRSAVFVQLGLGVCLGAGAGVLLRRRSERTAKFLLPHLVLGVPLAFSLWAGDRDWVGPAQVGGVVAFAAALTWVPDRHWLRAAVATGAGLLFAAFIVARPDAPNFTVPPVEAPAETSPDVVLIVLDTVRRDRLALFPEDGGTVETPHLDALATSGVALDEMRAASPWSVPSHASLFTGLLPSRHGATADTLRLDDATTTLAEHLEAAGYRTLAFTANPWVTSATGLSAGFQEVHEAGAEVVFESRLLLYRVLGEPLFGDGDKGGRRLVRMADLRLTEAFADPRPVFAFFNFTEAHAPYRRIPRASRRADGVLTTAAHRASLRALEAQHHAVPLDPSDVPEVVPAYDAAVRDADRVLGALMTVLDGPRGRDAVVLVTSDHGEHLGESGAWGHTYGLGPEVLAVPAVLRAPGLLPGRLDVPVSGADVAPTLAALAGHPMSEVDGVAWIERGEWNPALTERPGLVAEHAAPAATVAFLRAMGRDEEADRLDVGRRALIAPPLRYELATDGSEHLIHEGRGIDLAGDPAWNQRLEVMRGILRDVTGSAPRRLPAEPLSEERRERLRALGYLE